MTIRIIMTYIKKLLLPRNYDTLEIEDQLKYKLLIAPPLFVLPLNLINLAIALAKDAPLPDILSLFAVTLTLCFLIIFIRLNSNLKMMSYISLILYSIVLPLRILHSGGIYSPLGGFFVFILIYTYYLLGKNVSLIFGIFFSLFIITVAQLGEDINLVLYSHKRALLLYLTSVISTTLLLGTIIKMQVKLLKSSRDEAIRLGKAKADFLANMSHEIRTPMNGLIGMLQILKESSLSNEQADILNTAHSSANSLLTILNDILDLSKIEAGKVELETVHFELSHCVNDIRQLFSYAAEEKSNKITISSNIKGPIWIKADITRIKQIISNLLSNAIKFTQNGEIQIHYSAKEVGHNAIELDLSVIDNGIGISKENLDKLFTAFTQADNSMTRKFGGTGLGLSISSKLAQLMNGQIYVKSKINEGSTFGVHLLLQKMSPSEINELQENTSNTKETTVDFSNHYPHKILVVEDNKTNQKLISLMFRKLGYICTIRSNGQEAVDLLRRENDFTIIFMDIQMPIMNGIDATKIIRDDNLVDAPIIALTANAFDEDKNLCRQVGMDHIIIKPISFDDLKQALISTKYYS